MSVIINGKQELKGSINAKQSLIGDMAVKQGVDGKDYILTEEDKNEIAELISGTKANAIINSASGETILTTDSANDPLVGMKTFGKSWQNTVGGNQLFKMINSEGLGATISSDKQTVTCKAKTTTAYADLFVIYFDALTFKAGVTYYVSADIKLDSGTMELLNTIQMTDSSGSVITSSVAVTKPKISNNYQRYVFSFTTTTDKDTGRIYVQGYNANEAICSITNIMISTVNTEWEPYVGGIPSPNPNYPQEIHSNGESKNLFNHLDIDYMVVNANGDKRKGASFKEPNTYTISQNGTLGGTLYAKVLSADGTFGSTLYVNPKVTTTITHGQTLLVYTEDVSLSLLENAEVQVERGSVQTEYKPYGGSIEYGVYGGNLLNLTGTSTLTSVGLTAVPNGDGTYQLTGTATNNEPNLWFMGSYMGTRTVLTLPKGTYTIKDACLYVDAKKYANTFTLTEETAFNAIRGASVVNGTTYNKTLYPMLNVGTTALPWEPYTKQPFTLQTPNGLNGLPVSSGGNYTDSNGQQWICDEVDLKRGKYIQRVWKGSPTKALVFTSQDANGRAVGVNYDAFYVKATSTTLQAYCNKLKWSSLGNTNKTFAVYGSMGFYYKDTSKTLDEINTMFAEIGTDIEFAFILEKPIETDLTEEEIAQYKALMMNYPNTTILNDANAYTEVGYVADTKCYIDNKFKELETKLVNVTAELL